jgi:hydroxymethylglutaryl-CoA lyase
MQGIDAFIPTENKIRYINQLLKVGFDTIDFGSFVSPKAVPQMRDTAELIEGLDISSTSSKLLAIVANARGAEDAAAFPQISFMGYPLSVSETFQQRNTRKSIIDSLNEIEQIYSICQKSNQELVVYISMGFGNPYGDPYSVEIVSQFVGILQTLGITIISLADTVGVAEPEQINSLYSTVAASYPEIELGLHLHSTPAEAMAKIAAAYESGCQRIDGALKGFGGCPFAEDDLVGNIPTEQIIAYIETKQALDLDNQALEESIRFADHVFLQQ